MNYPERHPDLTAFVLGGLDTEESEETRRHLYRPAPAAETSSKEFRR
jgi:hypothetical protein